MAILLPQPAHSKTMSEPVITVDGDVSLTVVAPIYCFSGHRLPKSNTSC
jgi:hypothetical protein